MVRRLPLLSLLISSMAITLAVRPAVAQYHCDANACRLPDCHCASTAPPGGLDPADTPQLIVVTFDDAVHSYSEQLLRTFMYDLTNPDGRPAHWTYFVNELNTDPAVLRAVYDEGNEIANHTATHQTSAETNYQDWIAEITELDTFLADEIGIPRDQVVGFRAPYLETNEPLFDALRDRGFLYESSLPEQVTVPPLVSTGLDAWVWPHTLDYGAGLSCYANHCPDKPVPGLWVVPLWSWVGQDGVNYGAMDPGASAPSLFQHLLYYNFDSRYAGNRAPLGIFLHAGQMWQEERQQILHAFLKDKLAEDDVWMVTMRGLIEWMRDPVPTSEMAGWFARACDRGACRQQNVSIDRPSSPSSTRPLLFPNPTAGDATLSLHQDAARWVTVQLYDLLGRVVYSHGVMLPAGRSDVSIPLSQQRPGVYLYRVTAAQDVVARGMAVKR